MTRGGECEPESGIEVDERDDVSARAVDMLFKCIEGNTVAGIPSHKSLWFALRMVPFDGSDPSGTRDALRHDAQAAEVGDDATDGLWFWTGELLFGAELLEQRMELLFAKVRMIVPEPLDLFDDCSIPDAGAPDLRSTGAGIERFKRALSALQG